MIDDDIRRIPIKEFRESGYLQELNRQFLHPLGLALEVLQHDDGTEVLGGIWDYRNDAEGITMGLAVRSKNRIEYAIDKAKFVEIARANHEAARVELFGSTIEPLPPIPEVSK